MLEESVLSNSIIREEIKNNYEIDVMKIEKINRGSANIYKLYDSFNNAYILKEFQAKYKKDDIEKEIKIITCLKDYGIKVPSYIMTKDNSYNIFVDAEL